MTADVVLVGNLTGEVDLKFTKGGKPVANFSVAVNRRKKVGNDWEDELVGFFRCSCWDSLAENVSALPKGARVIVHGRLQQRTWEDKDGNKRRETEVQAFEVGPYLKWATVELHKTTRSDKASEPEVATAPPPAADWGPAPTPEPAEGGF